MASTSNYTKATVSFTLPISCQICLGKVKQPVICPNQHVFCTPCLDVWLRHNPLCPACRVPITPESPCKQIRGGPSPPEAKADRGLSRALRRARVDVIFDEYENNIQGLEDQVKHLQSERRRFEAATPSLNRVEDERSKVTERSDACREEVVKQMTVKLKSAKSVSERVKIEKEKLKETNSKLRDENVALSIENGRLKQSLAARSPRKYEKYAQAALQRKVDQCTKEIVQLKKALTRSDSYTEDLEKKIRLFTERYGNIEERQENRDCKNDDIIDFKGLSWTPTCVALSPKDILDGEVQADDWSLRKGIVEKVGTGDREGSAKTSHCLEQLSGLRPSQSCLTRDRDGLNEKWRPIQGNMEAASDGTNHVSHSLRLVHGTRTSGIGTRRDGASPAKRRLLMKDEDADGSDCRLGMSQQLGSGSSKYPESDPRNDLNDISELTDNSSTLEPPSSVLSMTPSTSLSRLLLQESPETLENMRKEKQSKWHRSLPPNNTGSEQSVNSRQTRRSRSPGRVPRSLFLDSGNCDDDDESSPTAEEEEVYESSSGDFLGMGQVAGSENGGSTDHPGVTENNDTGTALMDDSPEDAVQDGDASVGCVDPLRRGRTVVFQRDCTAHGIVDVRMDQARRSDKHQTASSLRRHGSPTDTQEVAGSSHSETLVNCTLTNLDYSMTPEFEDCTKLFREAENRLSSRQSAEK